MRISDLIRLTASTLKGRWTVLPAVGFAIAAFCLCFAGAILTSVRQEQSQPYEIVVSAPEGKALTDSDAAALAQLGDVTAATAMLEVPTTVMMGDTDVKLTLTGMDSNYIEGSYAQGGAYPASTVMPYIVLSEAACKALAPDTASMAEAPTVDWLNTSLSVQMGEGIKPVAAKVCGVLKPDDEDGETGEPAAYISLISARALLKQSGQNTGYGSLRARVTDIGHAESAARAVAALGLTVSNSAEELQAGWDMRTKEMTYLLVLGGFCLLGAAALTAAGRAVTLRQQGKALETLLWLGMKGRDASRLLTLHTLIAAAFGAAAGILVSLLLPSFLLAGAEETSSYTLPVPWAAAALSLGVCLLAGVAPAWASGKRRAL
jgi:hypothetical protein